MANNYRAIEAFARGLMSALLRDGEAETKTPKQTFVKTADIDAAVQRYIDAALAGTPNPPPPDAHEPPEQTELRFEGEPMYSDATVPTWIPPEMAQTVRDVAGDMRDLDRPLMSTPGVTQEMEQQSATYDPNQPGETPWSTPRS